MQETTLGIEGSKLLVKPCFWMICRSTFESCEETKKEKLQADLRLRLAVEKNQALFLV
jgi:hypothetical protein